MNVFGLYNWNTNTAMKVDWPAAYAGLASEKTYVGFDFWGNRFVPAFGGRLKFDVPADDCRIIAVRAFDGTKPVVVSSSRHVASPAFEVSDERWDAATKTLSGVSTVVPGEAYELRIAVPTGLTCVSAGEGTVAQAGGELRIVFRPQSERLVWSVRFR